MEARLPAHLEVSGLVRAVNSAGGFATVLHKGDRDGGTILIVLTQSGRDARLYERMPDLEGRCPWQCIRRQDSEKPSEFNEYLERRGERDRDAWIVELDVADGERFIL